MGGLFMAHAILTGLHAPALVSSVAIDANQSKATTKKATITGLQATKSHVSFERSDEALPMPIPKEWAPILPYVNDLSDLNAYGLKVTGLNEGKYKLSIDGKEVATYTSEQLAKGVNLGLLTSGPIYDQGKKVFDAINDKDNLVHHRFRQVVMFNAPDWLADVAKERKPAQLAKLLKQIEEKQAEIEKLVQPMPHKFVLQVVE
jgi:hypothetical protein